MEVVAIGEILVVLRPPKYHILETSRHLEILVGGSEANVLAGLARLGHTVGLITRVPDNPLGRLAIAKYESAGVDTSRVLWSPNGRMGLAFVELSTPPRKNRFIYDRTLSEASKLSKDDIDYDYVQKAKVLHLSGITPALSKNCSEVTKNLVDFAKRNGLIVSFDINYRKNLWSLDEAKEIINEIISNGVDIVFAKEEEISLLFGLHERSFKEAYKQLKEKYGIKQLIISLGTKGCYAIADNIFYKGQSYKVEQINRCGVGDSFVAGFLHGYLNNFSLQDSIMYGQAMSLVKYTILNENIPFVEKKLVDEVFESLKSGNIPLDAHAIER